MENRQTNSFKPISEVLAQELPNDNALVLKPEHIVDRVLQNHVIVCSEIKGQAFPLAFRQDDETESWLHHRILVNNYPLFLAESIRVDPFDKGSYQYLPLSDYILTHGSLQIREHEIYSPNVWAEVIQKLKAVKYFTVIDSPIYYTEAYLLKKKSQDLELYSLPAFGYFPGPFYHPQLPIVNLGDKVYPMELVHVLTLREGVLPAFN